MRLVAVRCIVERNRHVLSRCATGDESFIAELSGRDASFSVLEPKDDALVRISALVALGAPEVLLRSKRVPATKTSSQR